MSIVILGLGPGPWDKVTLEAKQVLDNAEEVLLRTTQHPTVDHLPGHLRLSSFDQLYETNPNHEDLAQTIAADVISLGKRPEGIIYAVPGHPLMGEPSVPLIMASAGDAGITIRIIDGLSFLEPALALLKLDPFDKGFQIVDAHHPHLDPTKPALVSQIYDRSLLDKLKDNLLEIFPENHSVSIIHSPGTTEQERVSSVPLHTLDEVSDITHLSCLYLPPLVQEEHLKGFNTLVHIMATLRSPEGCPWDREQTHDSLKPHLLQESYEVVEALDKKDLDKLCEELGDLLMQIAFHAQLASETGDFTVGDVLKSINTKLLRRHPHVFGDAEASDAAQVSHRWNEIKREEREDDESLLASVPELMPALMYSQAIQDRASGSGFDWENVAGVLGKLSEELEELIQAESPEERAGEFGDVLFTLVNVARWLNLDAEDSLRQSNRRFYRRFQRMEEMCRRQGKSFAEMSIEEMDELWDEVKTGEVNR
jgi:tetrapyrrole methylase family protein/MazG family protein